MKLISTIDKIAAWTLLACFLLFVLSGLDMQGRFLYPPVTSLIHTRYIYIPALIAFAVHSGYAIHLTFKRRRKWNPAARILLGLYEVLLAALLGYFILTRL